MQSKQGNGDSIESHASLASGAILSHYKIIEKIGAGGMGEVYRAQDTRLGRDVAIKVLSPHLAQTPEVRARFEREARTISQLNHRHICTLYDIGHYEGTDYLVMELLEGETLAHRLERGPLPVSEVFSLGSQIAEALDVAHRRGIIHRDLKPGNVMLTKAGVKLMDFGLARVRVAPIGGTAAESPTMSRPITEKGTLVGTFQYMAPEQLEGKEADARTDIWALGCVLYEMATGKTAFEGTSQASLIASILKETPRPITELQPLTPPDLDRLVKRCLAKDPDVRFQSASDLAFVLEGLLTASGSRPGDRAAGSGVGVGTPCISAGSLRFRQLTFRRGHVLSARLTPDGNTVVYSALWGSRPLEIFSTWPENPESRSLGFAGSDLLAISSSGDLALSLRRRFPAAYLRVGTLAQVPFAGGTARELLENVTCADWMPDGRNLAIVRRVEGRDRLEWPIGTVRYETTGGIDHLRVAPDGQAFAFNHHPVRSDSRGSVNVVNLSREVRILSDDWPHAMGLAWSPRGDEIWFTAWRTGHDAHLRAVSLSGGERTLLAAPGWLTLHDVSRSGRVLLTRDTTRREIRGCGPGATEEMDFSWHDWCNPTDLSSDGRTILFTEQAVGGGEAGSVYIRDTDGSPAVRLGDGYSLRLSGDGRWVLSLTQGPVHRLVLLPTGAGESRFLTPEEVWVIDASWHPDGKRVFFSERGDASGLSVHILDIESGETREFLTKLSVQAVGGISPDGRFFRAVASDGRRVLYPVDGGEPVPIRGLDSADGVASWSFDSRSLFVFQGGHIPAGVSRVNIETGARQLWRELSPADVTGVLRVGPVHVAPARPAYIYSYVRFLSDLFLVEGIA